MFKRIYAKKHAMHNNLNYKLKSKSVLVNCQEKQGKRYNRFLQRGNVLTDADAAYALIMMAMTLFDDFTSKFFGVVPGSSFFSASFGLAIRRHSKSQQWCHHQTERHYYSSAISYC